MKTIIKLCFILTLLLKFSGPSIAQPSAAEVSHKILFSIGKDEKPVFSESSIALSPIGNNVIVLTSDEEGRIFVYTSRLIIKSLAGKIYRVQ